jgi:hypothetical protein
VADSSPITLEQAQRDYLAGNWGAARTVLESLTEPGPDALALLALCRVRLALERQQPGERVDGPGLQNHLHQPLADARFEAERAFALGWLAWLAEEAERAEGHLAACCRRLAADEPGADPTEAAYWLARVRVSLGRPAAVTDFEQVVRSRGGSPRATCWYVDLLWRAGQVERAEQVWKAVRANRKVAGIDEAALLEARVLLRHGEVPRAERVLAEARPAGGVAQVERHLLLAWILSQRRQVDQADALLRQAEEGPYPAGVLATWRQLFNLRHGLAAAQTSRELPAPTIPASAPLALWLRGQEARQAGRDEEAIRAYREAAADPGLRPFARYGLACLGQDDFDQVLAAQPGLFLAVRCRARTLIERFRLRQAAPGEVLGPLEQAARLGYHHPALDHFHALAHLLAGQPTAGDVAEFARQGPGEAAEVRGNRLRAALECAARRLAPAEALALVAGWPEGELSAHDPALRQTIGLQLLRLLLLTVPPCPPADRRAAAEALRARAERLLGDHPRLLLVGDWLRPLPADAPPLPGAADPLTRLWRLACELKEMQGAKDGNAWRDEVAGLRANVRLRPPAQVLLVYEARRRGDPVGLLRLLQEVDAWQAFPAGPPDLVLRVLKSLSAADADTPAWRRTLAGWLALWEPARWSPAARLVAVRSGIVPLHPETDDPPPGTPRTPWLLLQAAQAIGRGEAGVALQWVQRALREEPGLEGAGAHAEAVRRALPELERRARAQALAAVVRFTPEQPPLAPDLLAGAADLLQDDPSGRAILALAAQGDLAGAREALAALAQRADLPRPLVHHLALIFHRAALYGEDQGRAELADRCWRLAWPCWLRFLDSEDGEAEPRYRPLLGRLLDIHARYINDFLCQDQVDAARRHWNYVEGLASLASEGNPALRGELGEAVPRFRAELASSYLTVTWEVLKTGAVAEGWRADYEKGLGYLRRLLSLDRDNVRLLTALVEICGDWFLDCYNNEDPRTLCEQVERFTPFALKLARLVEGRPGEWAARAALAEFCKYRGFIAANPAERISLYREAVRFNPDNENVRQLLAEVEAKE